jgi:hypothetical protein
MKKVIENGHVAVLVTARHGAGWYSWHDNQELLFDPEVVDMVRRKVDYHEIIEYCRENYSDEYYSGAAGLEVVLVPEGMRFKIDEYDGLETLVLEKDIQWIVA